ncbi:MAG: sterol desaturase family protein [Elusimicrobiota bacterium]
MDHTLISIRRVLALFLSLSLTFLSVEPAFSQVRAIAAESFSPAAGRPALPSQAQAGGALALPSVLVLNNNLASPFAAAPSLSAASLSVSAAAALAASPAALAAVSPAAKTAETEGAAAIALSASPNAVQHLAAPKTQERAAPVSDEEAGIDGRVLFDFARRPISSAFAIAGLYRAAGSKLEPSSSDAAPRSAVEPALPPAPAADKPRSLVSKILWGAGALALPVITFGWMSFLKSPGIVKPVASFTDWDAIARGVAFAGPLVVLAVWEAAKAYRNRKPGNLPWLKRLQLATALHTPVLPRLNHYLTNLAFGAVGIAMIAVFAGPHINEFNHFLDVHNVGLLRWLHVGGWKNVVAGITILDFMGWWWHYACHRYPLMWRLHKVHHSDIEYNFSTTYRTHWAEMFAEILGRCVMYALVGPTLLTITIYEIIIMGLAQYQHANIKMPEKLEAVLSRWFMTSHKHFIHHSLDASDYDTNYGFIFAAWDKMFGTYKSYDTAHLSNDMGTGIREYPRAQDLTFFKLLWMPFRSQKPDPNKELK